MYIGFGIGRVASLALGYGFFVSKFTILKTMKTITHVRQYVKRSCPRRDGKCYRRYPLPYRIKLDPLCRAQKERKRLRRRKRLWRRRFY